MLDADLAAFARKSLRSIWALEVLLHVRRSEAPLTEAALVRDMRATPALIHRIVEQLHGQKLLAIAASGEVSFQPSTPALADLCERLEFAALNRPLALRDAIISGSEAKLRDLADAFRVSGKKPQDHEEDP